MSATTSTSDDADVVAELRERWDEFEALLAKKRQQDSDVVWVLEAVHDHLEADQS